jgi:hypothetical protein
MASIVAASLGNSLLFAAILACSIILYFYGSTVTDVFLTIVSVLIFYTEASQNVVYIAAVSSVGVASILLGLYLKRREFIAALVGRTSVLRLSLCGIYGLIIGASLIVSYPTAVGIGLAIVAFALGVPLILYSAKRVAASRDLGIKSEDPIRTVSLIILLTSLPLLIFGSLGIFMTLFASFLLLAVYDKMYFAILVTFLMASGLYMVILDLVYVVTVVCIGAFVVILGEFTTGARTRSLGRSASRKKK